MIDEQFQIDDLNLTIDNLTIETDETENTESHANDSVENGHESDVNNGIGEEDVSENPDESSYNLGNGHGIQILPNIDKIFTDLVAMVLEGKSITETVNKLPTMYLESAGHESIELTAEFIRNSVVLQAAIVCRELFGSSDGDEEAI